MKERSILLKAVVVLNSYKFYEEHRKKNKIITF